MGLPLQGRRVPELPPWGPGSLGLRWSPCFYSTRGAIRRGSITQQARIHRGTAARAWYRVSVPRDKAESPYENALWPGISGFAERR